jgi:lysophospholipase L1-like esterase
MPENKKELEKEAIKQYLISFLNLEKRFPLLPGAQTISGVAGLIGLTEQELVDARTRLDDQAQLAAEEILKDSAMPNLVAKLPFKKKQVIVALGDSLTDDLQGWFEIFRHLVDQVCPDLELEWVNMAVSEDTSFDTLRRLNRSVIDREPDWVFISTGTFDAMRLHATPDRTFVSLTEFWENLITLENTIGQITKNPIVWITPPPVIPDLMIRMPLFEATLDEVDLKQYREVLAGRAGYIVDPKGFRMGNPPEEWNYLPDGFHPSIPGSIRTVIEVIKTLNRK